MWYSIACSHSLIPLGVFVAHEQFCPSRRAEWLTLEQEYLQAATHKKTLDGDFLGFRTKLSRISELVTASEDLQKEKARLDAFGEEKGLSHGRYVCIIRVLHPTRTQSCDFFSL